ncbi:MAG: bifunctional UDP-N-acetylglucosamine diphosphorylase/glucosamine-1-phosphate N-acetyltransferase GlmU [Anaerolineales bacterium]
MPTDAVILAAGHGTRMRSQLPKMLHPLLGRPMVQWVVDACSQATGRPLTMIVGPDADQLRSGIRGDIHYVVQKERLGTGHAVQQAADHLRDSELVLVVNGDLALVLESSLSDLIATQTDHDGPFSLISVRSDAARGFGRLIRDQDGRVQRILEAAHASPEQLAIDELNVGVYCFRGEWLWSKLPGLEVSPKGEYYLTDLVELASADGESIAVLEIDDINQAIGINTRVHLAEAEVELRMRINHKWMLAGVSMQDPSSTFVGPDVELAMDVTLMANTHLEGVTKIGEGSRIGPNTVVRDSVIGESCKLEASVIEGAELEDRVEVGPFSHLRPGTYLEDGVHIGNYGEIKNSHLGQGAKMGHFSYLGDATVGKEVNIGAGTITCNYDGEHKHPTEIGDGAFIGSDTMLVAPVKIGRGARTGAGAVVTKDVPDGTVAVGIPARVIRRLKLDNE